MELKMYDFAIIGGGIVGLSTGVAMDERYPQAKIGVIEKEKEVAMHQTGTNSCVIDARIYYKPRSFKARFEKRGRQSIKQICEKYDVDYDICGKVIVAT